MVGKLKEKKDGEGGKENGKVLERDVEKCGGELDTIEQLTGDRKGWKTLVKKQMDHLQWEQ